MTGTRTRGGRASRLVARVLPTRTKRFLKARLRGTRWFPSGPRRHVELTLPGRPPLVVDSPGNLSVPKALETKGVAGYEPFALECFLATLAKAGPGAVFDIGANVGLYALLAAAYCDRPIVAFEPTPHIAKVAKHIAVANGLAVRVEEVALTDSTGTATLYLSESTDSSNSLNAGFRLHYRKIDVPAETLDHYVARTGIVPAVIKVDTETTEPEVLAGGRAVIAEYRPWIVCEVLWSLVEDRLHAVMDAFDYHYYHLDGPGPRPEVERIVGDRTWTNFMFLLAPEPVGDDLWQAMTRWRTLLGATRPASHTAPLTKGRTTAGLTDL